jgi:hypothetical protein
VLALLNRGLLRASAKSTDAAVRAAKAAEDEAKASREAMERDWRPVLSFDRTMRYGGGIAMASEASHVRNVGRGPALNIRYLRRTRDADIQWGVTKLFSLAGSGDTADRPVWEDFDSLPSEPAEEIWGGLFPAATRVLVCQDQAGFVYRFVDPNPIPDVWQEGIEPKPAWVDWYHSWLASD